MVDTSETGHHPEATSVLPAAQPVVDCVDLRRVYESSQQSNRGRSRQVVALDGIDLAVREGEFVSVLGPSGCGKTTLLRLIAGFERPDSGMISFDGTPVAVAPSARAPGSRRPVFVPPERRRVGIVVQEHALFPHLTVAGNVGFGLPRNDASRNARIDEMLELVGLAEQQNRYPSELSGGQQQRVAIARALAPRPRVILLDEPFANLDASLRARLRVEVKEILRAAGATAVLVTHDQEEALSLADRIAVMNGGRLLQVGAPEHVYRRPASPFVARFVGEANIVAGESDGRVIQTPLGDLRVEGAAPAPGPALAAVRPEAVTLIPDPAGTGVVLAETYFGHDQLVELVIQGMPLRVRTASSQRLAVGDRVRAEVASDVVAFESVDA